MANNVQMKTNITAANILGMLNGGICERMCALCISYQIKDSPLSCSRGEKQPYIKSGKPSFCMEQEVESLILVSNGYFY